MPHKYNNTWVIGLTGGIGSGKTAVSDGFAEKGVPIIDADIIAREVVAIGSQGLEKITAKFGPSVVLESGALNRASLREIVFHNSEAKEWLNKCLHPLIREKMLHDIQAVNSPYCILAVPLLLENGLDAMVDRVLVVDCNEELQLERAMKRDGSNEATIRNIIASQISRTERVKRADEIIQNNGSLDDLPPQIEALHQSFMQLACTQS